MSAGNTGSMLGSRARAPDTPGARALWLGAAAILALAIVSWLGEGDMQDETMPALGSPWPTQALGCPEGQLPSQRAQELTREAEALWERASFAWADGPKAVVTLQRALQCARAAADFALVDSLKVRGDQWRKLVQRRVDREALRLELAERREDAAQVVVHVRRLSDLWVLADGEDASLTRAWLDSVRRRARVALARPAEDEEESE